MGENGRNKSPAPAPPTLVCSWFYLPPCPSARQHQLLSSPPLCLYLARHSCMLLLLSCHWLSKLVGLNSVSSTRLIFVLILCICSCLFLACAGWDQLAPAPFQSKAGAGSNPCKKGQREAKGRKRGQASQRFWCKHGNFVHCHHIYCIDRRNHRFLFGCSYQQNFFCYLFFRFSLPISRKSPSQFICRAQVEVSVFAQISCQPVQSVIISAFKIFPNYSL